MSQIVRTKIGEDIEVGMAVSVMRIEEPINNELTRTVVVNSGIICNVEKGMLTRFQLKTLDGHEIIYAFPRTLDYVTIAKNDEIVATLYLFEGILNLK